MFSPVPSRLGRRNRGHYRQSGPPNTTTRPCGNQDKNRDKSQTQSNTFLCRSSTGVCFWQNKRCINNKESHIRFSTFRPRQAYFSRQKRKAIFLKVAPSTARPSVSRSTHERKSRKATIKSRGGSKKRGWPVGGFGFRGGGGGRAKKVAKAKEGGRGDCLSLTRGWALCSQGQARHTISTLPKKYKNHFFSPSTSRSRNFSLLAQT